MTRIKNKLSKFMFDFQGTINNRGLGKMKAGIYREKREEVAISLVTMVTTMMVTIRWHWSLGQSLGWR